MSDNQADESNGNVKGAAGSFTGDHLVKNDGQADQARTAVTDKRTDLVDACPVAAANSTDVQPGAERTYVWAAPGCCWAARTSPTMSSASCWRTFLVGSSSSASSSSAA